MDKKKNYSIMAATAKQLIDLIQGRLNTRLDACNALQSTPLDTGVPDDVKKLREIEASKIRAVMQEQKDLIEIIKILYPDA